MIFLGSVPHILSQIMGTFLNSFVLYQVLSWIIRDGRQMTMFCLNFTDYLVNMEWCVDKVTYFKNHDKPTTYCNLKIFSKSETTCLLCCHISKDLPTSEVSLQCLHIHYSRNCKHFSKNCCAKFFPFI